MISHRLSPAFTNTRSLRPETAARVVGLAKSVRDLVIAEYGVTKGCPLLDGLEAKLLMALKEQDRDTRHACAEAVCAIESYGLIDARMALNRAHGACMNAHAI